jgi:hypothetical protein
MGYDSTPAVKYTWTCPHTGETFESYSQDAAHNLALQLSPNCDGTQFAQFLSPLTGLYQGNQTGSQQRMEANKSGTVDMSLPDISDATYAAGWLGTYVSSMPDSVIANNPDLGIIQKYPVSLGTAEVWKQFPSLKPDAYGAPAAGTATVSTGAVQQGSGNEPAYVQSTIDTLLGTSHGVGTQGSADSPFGSLTDSIKSAPIVLITIIGVGLLLIFMFGKGLSGKVAA